MYHQGMGTSPSSVSASHACLGPRAAVMACFGTTSTSLASLPSCSWDGCGSAVLLVRALLLMAVGLGASTTLSEAAGPPAMLLCSLCSSLQCSSALWKRAQGAKGAEALPICSAVLSSVNLGPESRN